LALTSPTGGGRSVGMVRSRTKATEFSFSFIIIIITVIIILVVVICEPWTVVASWARFLHQRLFEALIKI